VTHHLTLAERRVLLALVEHGHIAHDELDAEGNHALRQAVCGLRKKIDPSMCIVTVRGEGYWLEKVG
jgi:DNA-binding response OmpR family regulator